MKKGFLNALAFFVFRVVAEQFAGIGIGNIGASAMEGIARQPEAAGDIRMNMIIAAALVDAVALFAIVVCGFILS